MAVDVKAGTLDARVAESLRGFRVGGIASLLLVIGAILVAPPLAALVVLLWAWLSYTPLREIGFKRPESWLGVLVVGIVAGVALKLVMKAVVLAYFGAPPTNPMLHELTGNLQATLIASAEMIVLAGLAEEIVFRGYLVNRLQAVLGTGVAAGIAIVVLTAAFFGPLHYFGQGFFGALQATIVGVIFAAAYLLNGQRLWSLIVAHAAFDVASVWIAFAGLEEKLARSVFG